MDQRAPSMAVSTETPVVMGILRPPAASPCQDPLIAAGAPVASSSRFSSGDAQLGVMAVLATAMILTRLKHMAMSLFKLFTLPSRWKYITMHELARAGKRQHGPVLTLPQR